MGIYIHIINPDVTLFGSVHGQHSLNAIVPFKIPPQRTTGEVATFREGKRTKVILSE